jgi:hypothetical protein
MGSSHSPRLLTGTRRNENRLADGFFERRKFIRMQPLKLGDCFVSSRRTKSQPRERKVHPSRRLGRRRAHSLWPAKVTSSLDGFTTEDLLGSELIVSSAKHAEILGIALAAEGARVLVIELEECVRLAAPPVR